MGLRVVLAEDDPDIQLIAREALRRAGFDVTAVHDGPEALAAASASTYDAVLLDWMMPGMHGLEVCRRLKADPATASVPVIFLTARSQAGEIERGLALGALGYLTKPFDVFALDDQVRGLPAP